MEIIAYTNPGCGHCVTLKKLFKRAAVEYTSFEIGRDLTAVEFLQKFPGVTGYPHVIIDGVEIGGLTETAKLFLDKGLVEPPKR